MIGGKIGTLIGEIQNALAIYRGEWKEKKGLWTFSAVVAERKVFLARKKLTYSANIRIDDTAKTLRFSEMLTESGSGFSSVGDIDGGFSTGFGVKTETYNTFKSARQGSIEEQSHLFGKDYSYTFNYSEVRERVRVLVEKSGFSLDYQVLPVK